MRENLFAIRKPLLNSVGKHFFSAQSVPKLFAPIILPSCHVDTWVMQYFCASWLDT